jgi:hypothetical protein
MLWESVVKFAELLKSQSPFEETTHLSAEKNKRQLVLSSSSREEKMNAGMTPK